MSGSNMHMISNVVTMVSDLLWRWELSQDSAGEMIERFAYTIQAFRHYNR
jgi:hypothetical protein